MTGYTENERVLTVAWCLLVVSAACTANVATTDRNGDSARHRSARTHDTKRLSGCHQPFCAVRCQFTHGHCAGDGGDRVTGVYEYALGDAADDLHPKVRDRYALGPDDGYATVGTGRMDITRGTLAVPALYAMTTRDMLFPESGEDVPLTVTTVGFRDDAGREALTTRREFDFDGTRRRFDSTTVWDAETGRLFDFLGSGGLVVSELHPRVEDGALVVEGGHQWLRVAGRYLPIPGPLAVDVEVRDRYDEAEERFHVTATVESALAGHILGYRGAFTQDRREMETVTPEWRPTKGPERLPPR